MVRAPKGRNKVTALPHDASLFADVKGVLELNVDLLDKKPPDAPFFTGHLGKENYVLVGIDVAF
jgi:hypothetical protein